MNLSREAARKIAQEKDKQEFEMKKREYEGYMDWWDRGILYDLREIFGIPDPSFEVLLPIGLALARCIKMDLGRQEKRRKPLIIDWINKNYSRVEKYVRRMVICKEQVELRGPNVSVWNAICEEDPTAPVLIDLDLNSPDHSRRH
jgi:hypothetical protein